MAELNNLFHNPWFLALSVALLSALIAPYVIERTKANISRREKIVTTQFEIIESLAALSSRYVMSAKFILSDFSSGKLLGKAFETRLLNYEVATEETLRGSQVQAYKARIYFVDATIYEMVMDLHQKIASVDVSVLRLIDRIDGNSMVADKEMRLESARISDEIHNLNLAAERLLEFLFARTGKVPARIDTSSTIGTGKELPTR